MKELSPEQWGRIDTLFEKVLQNPPGKRYRFLNEMCRDDTALFNELKKLLEIHDEASLILGDSVTEFISPIIAGLADAPVKNLDTQDSDYTDLPPGKTIGMYKISEKIDRGGMGDIYLVYRTDQLYDHPVALKVMRGRINQHDRLRQFEAERKILASLDHPNIARLYDGGISDEGQPYFVMEYVEGEPLDQYCAKQKCTIAEKIQLFLKICLAVGYAHQNLVVHRDLKPSNILVKANGTVKLLDFGIAKFLSEETSGGNPEKSDHFLSLAYASPEQLASENLTTTSDVFSLGVIFYKLLTGSYPFPSRTPLKRNLPDLEIPALPSESILNNTDYQTADQPIASKKISKMLAGDLDAIAIKALKNNPAERYQSTEQLIEDIRRYEQKMPVLAVPGTTGYRLKKFIYRRAAGFTTSVIALFLLAAFTITLIFQQSETLKERNIALIERDKAAEIATFLEELLASADPSYGTERTDTLRIRDLLQSGTERVRRELDGQPSIQAQLMNVLGNVYSNLGNYDESRPLLEQALQIRASLHASDHPDIAESLNSLGSMLHKSGEYDTAAEHAKRALDMRLRLFGPLHEDVAKSYTTLANVKNTTGNYDEAETLYRESLSINTQLNHKPTKSRAISTANLATILQRKGNLDEAEAFHREALNMYHVVLSKDHPLIATSSNNLSLLLTERGFFDEALPFARNAFEMRQSLYGEQHPQSLSSMNNLASILADLGDLENAEKLYIRSLELRKMQHGEMSMPVAVGYNNLASLLRNDGRYNDATPLFKKATEIAVSVLGLDHSNVGILTSNLAGSLRLEGKLAEANQHYTSALSLLQETLSDDHPSTARVKIGLAKCLTDQGSFERAEVLITEGYDVLQEKGSNLQIAHEAFIKLYTAWNRPEDVAIYQNLLTSTEVVYN